MAKFPIPAGATITNILDRLRGPEEYVRGVFHNFHEARRELGRDEIEVFIGNSGEGKYPHYKIRDTAVSPLMKTYRRAFHGRTHKVLLESRDLDINWSERGMTYDEVRSLLGRLRGRV